MVYLLIIFISDLYFVKKNILVMSCWENNILEPMISVSHTEFAFN